MTRILLRHGIAVIALILSSCSVSTDLIETGLLDLERETGSDVTIRSVTAYQKQASLIVKGYVAPKVALGRVNIQVVGINNSILAETEAPVVTRRRSRHSRPFPRFEATLNVTPPKGSVLRLRHIPTSEPHAEGAEKNTGQEAAPQANKWKAAANRSKLMSKGLLSRKTL